MAGDQTGPDTRELLRRWAARLGGPPVTVSREVANRAENVLLRLERNPDLTRRIGLTDYDLDWIAGARFALSTAIEETDRRRHAGEEATDGCRRDQPEGDGRGH